MMVIQCRLNQKKMFGHFSKKTDIYAVDLWDFIADQWVLDFYGDITNEGWRLFPPAARSICDPLMMISMTGTSGNHCN